MAEVRGQGFHNADCVKHELLNFLALNTEHESVEQLKKDVSALQIELKALSKFLTETNKAALAGTNKATQNAKDLSALTTRVKKLE